MKKSKIFLIIVLIVLLTVGGVLLYLSPSSSSEIGSNDLGNVVKDVYNKHSNSNVKIAIISGMHPRETLHSSVLPQVSSVFGAFNNVEIVNYKVTVTNNPNDFSISRQNGESLVHDYVVNDIAKENYDLVIIGHDHEKGYGEGYYIATPVMDNMSVSLANEVHSNLTDFNYYTRDTSTKSQSSSIVNVDQPIVATGTKLFVYEIPEWLDFFNGFDNSYKLIESSYNALLN